MKILFLHMTMGLTNRGSEVVVDELASELTKKHDVMVISAGKLDAKKYQFKRVYPIDIAPPTAPASLLGKIATRMHLDAESGAVANFTHAAIPDISAFAPDIIVCINGYTQLKILRGQALPSKLVYFGHAGIGHHDRSALSLSPSLFVALTETAHAWATERARAKTKVVYIPNPIKLSKPKKIDLHLTAPVVLCVGALSAYKNILSVVKAIRDTSCSLLLIGDGEISGELELELSTMPNEFRWIKQVEPEDMPDYYASSDVFCFVPDPQEAFGRVYLEAMVAGLPIVASDDAIRRSIVGEQAIYVEPRDTAAISQAITTASQKGKLDYKGELAPFALNTVESQIEKEFHDLIS